MQHPDHIGEHVDQFEIANMPGFLAVPVPQYLLSSRKRKLPVDECFRPSKVLVTEVARDFDNLQLQPSDGASRSVGTGAETMTWATFMDEPMEVVCPSGRRVCPQLEMTPSLKEAIRLAEQSEEQPLPEAILTAILRPVENTCTALIPYVPPQSILANSVVHNIVSNVPETVKNIAIRRSQSEEMITDEEVSQQS